MFTLFNFPNKYFPTFVVPYVVLLLCRIKNDFVRVQDRLMYFIKRLAHFITIQYADYYT